MVRLAVLDRPAAFFRAMRALPGGEGGGGGGGGGGGVADGVGFGMASEASMAPTASTAPPVTVTPLRLGSAFTPFLIAWTICDGDAPGSAARTSAATPATCGVAIDV